MQGDASRRAVLKLENYNTHASLLVRKPNTVGSELTGDLIEAEWGTDVDSPCASGTITIFRGKNTDSLAPLMNGGAASALLWPGSYFNLRTNTVPAGWGPQIGNYFNAFTGRIDNVNMAPDERSITLTCRDSGASAIDTWVHSTTGISYGPDAVENIMDQIMADFLPASSPSATFLPGGSPGWVVSQYPQEEMSVMDAMRALALQIGWDLRWKGVTLFDLSALTNAFYLADPDRAKTTPDASLTSREWLKITALDVNDADVRNQIEVWYGERLLYQTENTTSIAQYGPKWMRIAEELSSNVTTSGEAVTMGEAALADLSQPIITHEIECRYWPYVELNDLQEYQADNIHYNDPQTLAVYGYHHKLSLDQSRTTIRARGAPSSANANWRVGQPEKAFVSLNEPFGPAPEKSIWMKTDSVAFL